MSKRNNFSVGQATQDQDIDRPVVSDVPVEVRRAYCAPRIEDLGDIRSVTLGPTAGSFESGAPETLQE
jgi:hypothetical protein